MSEIGLRSSAGLVVWCLEVRIKVTSERMDLKDDGCQRIFLLSQSVLKSAKILKHAIKRFPSEMLQFY